MQKQKYTPEMSTENTDKDSFNDYDTNNNRVGNDIATSTQRRGHSTNRFRGSVALSHNTATLNGQLPPAIPATGGPVLSSTKHHEIEKAVAVDIAICISNELKTLGLIAALLSSWAVTVYGGEVPLDDGLCFGRTMVQATYVVFWVSLGFFFLCVSSTLAIIADLDGVPQKYLFKHFQQTCVRVIYQVPELSMIFGTITLAVAYAMDVGERAGCPFLYFGCFAAFGFVGAVAVMFWFLKQARKRLHDDHLTATDGGSASSTNGMPLGRHFIATWRDRLDYCLEENSYYQGSTCSDDNRRLSHTASQLGISPSSL